MTSHEEVLRAAEVGETTDWEFKSAKGGFPGSFWQTYSAMANSEGGVILLGVRETDDGLRVDGLASERIALHRKTAFDGANNKAAISVNLLSESDVTVVEMGTAQLLSVRIPRATRTQRPVYHGPVPFGNTYRRLHEGDYRCDDAEVRRMLADADPLARDQKILAGFSLDDLDGASLRQYRQRIVAAKGDHPWLGLGDREFLEKLGGWRREREVESEGLTLAGLLMFGKDTAIRLPEAAPAYFVDYRERLDPTTRWSDRIHPDGTWEANLFQFYQRVSPRLASALPVPFRLEGGVRKDETPAHVALREAFVNALIHCDYAEGGGIVVERHPDKVVIQNPGTLLVSLEQYARGGITECRNRALQKMFAMIGGGEQAGSGTAKIRAGWKWQAWRAPLIEVIDQPDRIRLTLPMVSLIPQETVERLRAHLGPLYDQMSADELQALATADIEEGVSNARLQQLLSTHPWDITRMLQGLCQRGLLVSDNRKRWTVYRLGLGVGAGPLFEKAGRAEVASSPHLPGDSPHLATGEVLDEEFERLKTIAKPIANRGKAPVPEVRAVIQELCRGRFLSADQLASLLNRGVPNLRDRYLTPMVVDGDLAFRYPAIPNRPDQAYTTRPRDR